MLLPWKGSERSECTTVERMEVRNSAAKKEMRSSASGWCCCYPRPRLNTFCRKPGACIRGKEHALVPDKDVQYRRSAYLAVASLAVQLSIHVSSREHGTRRFVIFPARDHLRRRHTRVINYCRHSHASRRLSCKCTSLDKLILAFKQAGQEMPSRYRSSTSARYAPPHVNYCSL